MEEILLNAEQRQMIGKKVKHLRREGYVPGILYGHRTDAMSVKLEQRALDHVLQQAGTNRLVTLNIAGVPDAKRVLIRDLQRDVITHAVLHVDLYEVIMTEKITAEVPVVFVGESPVVVAGEGILFEGLDTIEIECLPGDLLPTIEVNISGLAAIDAAIQVRDLKLGDAIQILDDPDDIVVKVLPPEKEEIEEIAPEVAEVEVVGEEREKAPAEEEAGDSED